eukprot:gene3650-4167_t
MDVYFSTDIYRGNVENLLLSTTLHLAEIATNIVNLTFDHWHGCQRAHEPDRVRVLTLTFVKRLFATMDCKYCMLTLAIILSVTSNRKIVFIDATTCLPRFHPLTQYKHVHEIYKRTDFTSASTGNFTEIVLDSLNENLLVGARNYLFVLDADNLVLKKNISWMNKDSIQRCLNSGRSKRNCQNYIQLIKPFKNRLFICGTNSMNPVYNITKLDDPGFVVEANKDARGQCSMLPDLRPVAVFSRLNELVSSTFMDRNGRGPVIRGTYLDKRKTSWEPINTNLYSLVIFKNPDFKASFAIDPSVYIFFNEAAMERSQVNAKEQTYDQRIHATVARVCQNDNGGSMHILEYQWTTFRKTRLECTVKGYEDVTFNILKTMTWKKETKNFYGIFETSSRSIKASAMCVFSLEDLERIFDGDFLHQKTTDSTWTRVKNPKHFSKCTVTPTSLKKYSMEAYNETVQPGKQPTNFMTGKALADSYRYILMYENMKAAVGFSFYRILESFIDIAVDVIERDGKESHVLAYIATEQGTILVLHLNSARKMTCAVEEIHLFEDKSKGKIKRLKLWKEKQQLFISTDDRVIKLSLDICFRYTNQSLCLEARHPRCGWVVSERKCMSLVNITDDKKLASGNLLQDLEKCPTRKAAKALGAPNLAPASTTTAYPSLLFCLSAPLLQFVIGLRGPIGTYAKMKGPVAGIADAGGDDAEHAVTATAMATLLVSVTKSLGCQRAWWTVAGPCGRSGPFVTTIRVALVSGQGNDNAANHHQSAVDFPVLVIDVNVKNAVPSQYRIPAFFRVKTCFSSCGNKKGCPRDQIQNRTCLCKNNKKSKGQSGTGVIFTSVPHTGSDSSRTGQQGFKLSDMIIAVAGSILPCLVLCFTVLYCVVKRKRKRNGAAWKDRKYAPEDVTQLPLRVIEQRHENKTDTEKRPLSSDSSDSSIDNNKPVVPINLDRSVVVGVAFKTTNKSPSNGKLKMFGEDMDYDIGITSF